MIEVQRFKRYNNFLLSVRIFCVDKIIERNNYTVTIHGWRQRHDISREGISNSCRRIGLQMLFKK